MFFYSVWLFTLSLSCRGSGSVQEIDEEELRQHLSGMLTDYMVPSFYVRLDAMPLTPNGKIDRKALPVPDNASRKALENVLPTTNKESALLAIAQEILQNQDFGVTDDLLSLGMTSIQAIRFSAMAQKKKIHVTTNTLLKKRTIRKLLVASLKIFSWHKPYDPEKPVLVFFLGIYYPSYSRTFLDRLSERFSLLVFETISEHYKYLFLNETFMDMIHLYFEIISLALRDKKKIFALSGICWGGVIAYHIAEKYRNLCGEKPYVFLIDSFLHSDKNRERLSGKMKSVDLTSADFTVHGNDYHDYERRSETVAAKLEDLHPYPAYDGQVTLYSSTKNKEPDFPSIQKENHEIWKRLTQDIEIIDIDDNHENLCEAATSFSIYSEKIFSVLDKSENVQTETDGKQ